MYLATDFKRMTDQLASDYNARIATLRGQFKHLHQMLGEVRPPLVRFHRTMQQDVANMRTHTRAEQQKMATDLHRFLKTSVQRIKSNAHAIQANAQHTMAGLRTEMQGMHAAAQNCFKTMAQARAMHPLYGKSMAEEPMHPKRSHNRKKHHRAKRSH